MILIKERDLRNVVQEIIKKAGSEEKETALVADHLVRSNLAGHDSHGVGMIPRYIESISQGFLKPNVPAKLVKEDGSILIFDGERGYGQRTAHEAMNAAMKKCRETGLVAVVLRNAHHIGRVGTYGEQSIEAGLVSVHFVNVVGHGIVTPYGGRDGRLGTNPICIAIPGTSNNESILLDMATSKLPVGKVLVAVNAGKQVPDDAIIDADGNQTNDPKALFSDPRGALLPLGRHKGYGIALICELLAGVLGGGGTSETFDGQSGGIINNMLTFVVDPKRLVDIDWMQREIDTIIAHVKESPPQDLDNPVMVAGDPERRTAAERRAQGIPLNTETWKQIIEAGGSLGIGRTTLESYAMLG